MSKLKFCADEVGGLELLYIHDAEVLCLAVSVVNPDGTDAAAVHCFVEPLAVSVAGLALADFPGGQAKGFGQLCSTQGGGFFYYSLKIVHVVTRCG